MSASNKQAAGVGTLNSVRIKSATVVPAAEILPATPQRQAKPASTIAANAVISHDISKLPPAGSSVIVVAPAVVLPTADVIPLALPADALLSSPLRPSPPLSSPPRSSPIRASQQSGSLTANTSGQAKDAGSEDSDGDGGEEVLPAPAAHPSLSAKPCAGGGAMPAEVENSAAINAYKTALAKEYAKKNRETKTLSASSVRFYGLMSRLRDAHKTRITAVAYSDDERLLASGSADGMIAVWDVAAQRVMRYLDNHVGTVHSLMWANAAISNSYTLLSCGKDATVKIWDVENAMCSVTMRDHGHNGMYAAYWSSDGTMLATTGRSKHVLVYNLARAKAKEINLTRGSKDCVMVDIKPRSEQFPTGHSDTVRCMVWAHDNFHIFTGSDDKSIKMWNIPRGGECVQTLVGHTGKITCLTLDEAGHRLLSASSDGSVRVWDIVSGSQARVIGTAHVGGVNAAAFSPEIGGRRIISLGADGEAAIWETSTGLLMQRLPKLHPGGATCLAIRSDGLVFVSGGADSTVGMWRAIPPACCETVGWSIYSCGKSSMETIHALLPARRSEAEEGTTDAQSPRSDTGR